MPEVMTVSEVADYLRVNPQTVYRKAKLGELPAMRIGRAIRFRKSELESWLQTGRVGGALHSIEEMDAIRRH